MAKTRQLLSNAEVETAKRRRICHHNRRKHSIAQGERCLVIKQADGGTKNYCLECGNAILDVVDADAQRLRRTLNEE